jgi:hypothetical protein
MVAGSVERLGWQVVAGLSGWKVMKIRPPGKRVKAAVSLAILLFLIVAALLWAFTPKYLMDSTLIATDPREYETEFHAKIQGGPSFFRPFWKLYFHWQPPLIAGTFPPKETRACDIFSFLTMAHDVSGIQFFIDREVASGSVLFGTTNPMSSAVWVTAFTNALQSAKPAWWDRSEELRRENLVVLQINPRTVLVLPRERAAEYESGK